MLSSFGILNIKSSSIKEFKKRIRRKKLCIDKTMKLTNRRKIHGYLRTFLSASAKKSQMHLSTTVYRRKFEKEERESKYNTNHTRVIF